MKKVKCINVENTGEWLEHGMTYEVVSEGKSQYFLSGVGYIWDKTRFIEAPFCTLELTEEEAETIYTLVANTAGCIHNSPRKFAHTVYEKLALILEVTEHSKYYDLLDSKYDLIVFNDFPQVKTPQQLKIEELEATINQAQKQLQQLKESV